MEDPPPSATWHPALRPETLDDASLYSPIEDGPRLITLSWDDVVARTPLRSRAPTQTHQQIQQIVSTTLGEEFGSSREQTSQRDQVAENFYGNPSQGQSHAQQGVSIGNLGHQEPTQVNPTPPLDTMNHVIEEQAHTEAFPSLPEIVFSSVANNDSREIDEIVENLEKDIRSLRSEGKDDEADLLERDFESFRPELSDLSPAPQSNSNIPTGAQREIEPEEESADNFFSVSQQQEGRDENIDAAWGGIDSLPHTNSFPPVPFPDFGPGKPQPLAHSQATAVIQEEEDFESHSTNTNHQEDSADPWGAAEDNFSNDAGFFSQSQLAAQGPSTPPDEEARFEERLPLVPQDQPHATDSPYQEETNFSFDEQAAWKGDDFFSRVPGESQGLSSETQFLESDSAQQASENQALNDFDSAAWGEVDDGIFGSNQKSVADLPSEEAPPVAGGNLDAMWAAAMDDDLLDDSVDPSSFFGDEDDGFLENGNESHTEPVATTQSYQPTQQSVQSQGYQVQSTPAITSYTPAGFDVAAYQRSQSPFQTQPLRPSITTPAESFVSKSKDGYASPYDAPMDLSRPKRAQSQRGPQILTRNGPAAAPPPRRNDSVQSGYAPTPTAVTASPSIPAYESPVDRSRAASVPFPSASTSKPPVASAPRANASGFFEELPMVARTRSTTAVGRFTPQATPQQAAFPPPPTYQQPPVQNHQPILAPAKPQDFGLVGPAKVMPYSDSAVSSPVLPAPPAQPVAPSSAGGRYSPAPAQQAQPNTAQQAPNHAPRAVPPNPYAQPNAAAGITRPPSAPHQHIPHKPSPLSRSSSATHYRPGDQPANSSSTEAAHFPGGVRPSLLRHSQTSGDLPSQNAALETNRLALMADSDTPDQTIHPPSVARDLKQSYIASKQLPSLPVHQEVENTESMPPVFQPIPPSVQPIREIESYSASQQKILTAANRVRAPSLTGNSNFIPPADASAQDPLNRWQGAPIFRFGFGGVVVTSFPARIPRYSAGSRTPFIKCNPGETRILTAKVLPINETVAAFPGPLKSKSKKKDVLLWMQNGIAALAQAHPGAAGPNSGDDDQKRHEEKIMLWKVLAILVEHDGVLEGNARALEALRSILSPEASTQRNQEGVAQSYLPAISSPEGLFKPSASTGSSMDILRQSLLNGDREKAVWHAVDQKLWGHAMLIASTMPPQLWKQVATEFVRNEVKPAGRNTESLAALYNVFAGNCEESMDELVPPSARAGLTLMSKNNQNGFVSSGLDGLNRWRETLNLILSNRTKEDTKAIVAMAQLLASYGRIEASHICYILARLPGFFGGPDDPNAAVVLLGTDHKQSPFEYAHDLEGILLTEVFEFVNSTLTATPAQGFAMPHLQAFKLYHAETLAELGLRDEAQQYCDAIAAAQKSNASRSPYLNQRLSASVEELSLRLRQSSKDSSGSWISQPNVDKISGSFFKGLSRFIAGDDDEDNTNAAKADMEGPFARISGNTPEMLSRNASPALGSGSLNVPQNYLPQSSAGLSPVNSRYAPVGLSSANIPQAMSSPEHPPPTKNTYAPQASLHQTDSAAYQATPYSYASQTAPAPPSLMVASNGSPQASQFNLSNQTSSGVHNPYFSPPASELGTSPSGQIHETRIPPRLLSPETNDNTRPTTSGSAKSRYSPGPNYTPRSASLEPRGSGYEPMSTTYQPRSYAPSPGLEPVQSNHVDSYQPSVPMYGYSSNEGMQSMHDNHYPGSGDDLPLRDDLPEHTSSPQKQPANDNMEIDDVEGSFSNGYQPQSTGYEPSNTGYQPSSYGYEPTYGEEEGANQEEAKSPRKKKSFMDDDDDDDLASRAAALKGSSKSKPREVDDNVRRAIEEDAKRDAAAKSGGGWFGSIWGRSASKDAKQPEQKAHQIKLGEENAFYYDKDLKKWINKNADPSAATATAAAPPPPKGPPMRSVSAAPGPPASTRVPSNGPPGMIGSSLQPPRPESATGHLPAAPTGLAPPSRPGTGMSGVSNASSMDDLIGPAQPRKGGTIKKSKKGRGYVDVLGDKS